MRGGHAPIKPDSAPGAGSLERAADATDITDTTKGAKTAEDLAKDEQEATRLRTSRPSSDAITKVRTRGRT